MDSTQRDPGDDASGETPADVASCQSRKLAIRVAVSVASVIVVMGLISTLTVLAMRAAAPETDQATKGSEQELMDRLHQWQKDYRDLSLMLDNVTQDPRCSVCPKRWLWWRHRCYFFSVGWEENLQWSESAEFCQRHNSSLAVIKDLAEMEFIQGVMKTFSQFPFLWVGLTDSKEEGRWVWWDGTVLQHYMAVKVEWDAEQRDCADLRGGGSLFAVDCEAYGPWVCNKES